MPKYSIVRTKPHRHPFPLFCRKQCFSAIPRNKMGNILKKLRNKLYNLYRFTLPKLQLTLHEAASDKVHLSQFSQLLLYRRFRPSPFFCYLPDFYSWIL